MAAVYIHDRDHLFRCTRCNLEFQGKDAYCTHIGTTNHPRPLQCGECVLSYEHLTSLIRHIKDVHNLNPHPVPVVQQQVAEDAAQGDLHVADAQGALGNDESEDEEDHLQDHPDEDEEDAQIDLEESAARMVINLRQFGGVTNATVQRCQEECFRMMKDLSIDMRQKVRQFLTNANIDTPESRNLLQEMVPEDPFSHVRDIKQQLNFLARRFGLVKPETKFIGYRIDWTLNPITAQYVPTQVPMSFEYVPLIKTLTLFLSMTKNAESVATERPSDDKALRTYLDGSRSKNNALVSRFPQILRIQLYWDDLEVVNPLGSKTSVHKLASFYFSIQNMPLVESGQVSSIFLVTLAFSEDLKGPQSFEKVLAPFLYDLRKLESDNGVMVTINGEPVQLRATLTLLCADTLAAHEILGFLSPSARHFCRRCMVSRPEFHLNLNAVGPKRTKEQFEDHVRRVKIEPRFSRECGVKATGCVLHASRCFDATQDAVFDIFHDLLEGVCHWVVSLALRSFIIQHKFFSLEDFNGRVKAFNYGVPDVKNKPSCNFTEESLKGHKLKQTGSQMWCLIRVFGFLVADVPGDSPNLKLVNLLQQIMLIVFSDAAQDEHITRLDRLIEEHHTLFQHLYVDELNDEEEEDIDNPTEELREVPAARRVKAKLGNKLHHMKHYPDDLRAIGSLLRCWCARYEGRHQIFSKYGACCCNYINIVKSMAQMFQVTTLSGILKETLRAEDIESVGAQEVSVEHCQHSALLQEAGRRSTDLMQMVDAVIIAGEQYRPGLFVLIDCATPTFALIQSVYIYGRVVYFILMPWRTIVFEDRYCAFRLQPRQELLSIVHVHHALARHGAFSPWNPFDQRSVYVAPRTLIF